MHLFLTCFVFHFNCSHALVSRVKERFKNIQVQIERVPEYRCFFTSGLSMLHLQPAGQNHYYDSSILTVFKKISLTDLKSKP